MGLDIAKASLAAGHDVVATDRNADAVARAVTATAGRVGGIDVLVNNAAGFLEEQAPRRLRLRG